MITFNLYQDVIIDFSKNELFTRFSTTINGIGREEKTQVHAINLFVYAHPATDADLREVSRQGYHPESMIKIFSKVDSDILADDEITYSGQQYRVMKTNAKLVGNYKKLFAELLKA